MGGLSITSAMFIFQACYGTPQDMGLDTYIEGQVTSESTGLPIKGIQISVGDGIQREITDEEGKFSFYIETSESIELLFKDVDAEENGQFVERDTVVKNPGRHKYLEIKMEEK